MNTVPNKKKKSNTSTKVLIVLSVLVVIFIVLAMMGVFKPKSNNEVETVKVEKRTISETVAANGKLQPETEVKISADISGEIIELPIKEGDKVKKGQLLCRIKPDQFQREMERVEASLNNSRANLAGTRAQAAQSNANYQKSIVQFKRNKALYEQKVLSESDFENIKAEFEVTKAQYEAAMENVNASSYSLKSAEASLKESQYALSKTSIYSPMDGTISRLNVELGERVVGTMQMTGTEMMRVANLSVMEAEVEVNENDIPNLELNDTSEVEVDAYRNETFKGIVTSIANSSGSTTDQISSEKVTNFKVKIRVLESSYKKLIGDLKLSSGTPFKPGMTCAVTIHTKTAENVLTVPILAVTVRKDDPMVNSQTDKKDNQTAKREENGKKSNEIVFLYNNGKAKSISVKSGLIDGTYIEILSGLKLGDEVISGPFSLLSTTLKDGDEVKKSTPIVDSKGKK